MNPDRHRQQESVSSHAKLQLRLKVFHNCRHVTRYRRERQTKASAFSQLTLNFNSATMLSDDLIDNHQSETRPMTAIFRCVKRIEDATHHLRCHSGSGI